ncbi:integrase-like protein [Sphingobacterium allocomposti]|uniref:Integrase-like protein n=1 Tax=Sphingobacterium allocomposti TaxID=415956 RepID=A0A5S5CY85_9SPHI|nr:site-specific integrase [Sphingobacterium composti Yoo et al. 2007 non Ten et al. 2007]TYP88740.1 integrase-like protein [Sphingobacterium composti Yoo et al. 2007 non Ten et al. 2007]
MATVSAKVYEHHKKADGTYNVKICVYHKGIRKYIDTTHFVVRKQLTKNFKIKDCFIADIVEQQLRKYRNTISDLEEKLDHFSAEALRDFLRDMDEEVDFVKFCDEHIKGLKEVGRIKSAENFNVVRNSLVDYFKTDSFSINQIHYTMLLSYERFLKSERTMTRTNQFGKPVTTTVKGVSNSAVHNYMRDLRTLFNAARNRYNEEDIGIFRIKHYPFKKYKIGSPPPRTKDRNNSLEEVLAIRDCATKSGSRAELAKELYMLSFYLCGTNAVDFYQLGGQNIRNGRLEYNRSKTAESRKDNAFISIKIVDKARPLLEKYIGKLTERYSTIGCLNKALSKGMEQICRQIGLSGVTFYWARHTFANTARNDCRMSKDDVALALNHVDEGNRTTDIYIAKDWKIVDDVQSKVMEKLKEIEAIRVDLGIVGIVIG